MLNASILSTSSNLTLGVRLAQGGVGESGHTVSWFLTQNGGGAPQGWWLFGMGSDDSASSTTNTQGIAVIVLGFSDNASHQVGTVAASTYRSNYDPEYTITFS